LALAELGSDGNLTDVGLVGNKIRDYISNPKYKKVKRIVLMEEDIEEEDWMQFVAAHEDTLESLKFDFDDFIQSDTDNVEVLTQFKQLKELKVHDFEDFQILPNLPSLTKLTVKPISTFFIYADHSSMPINLMEATISELKYMDYHLPQNSMPNMKTIKISSDHVWQEPYDEEDDVDESERDYYSFRERLFIDLPRACPNLKSYQIYSNEQNLSVGTFLKIVKSGRNLEELKFILRTDEISIDMIVPQIIQKMRNLKFLDLEGWTLSAKSSHQLLRKSANLTAVRCNGRFFHKSGDRVFERNLLDDGEVNDVDGREVNDETRSFFELRL